MTMAVKITNEDTNPHRAVRVDVVDRGAEPAQQAILRPGESFTAWIHSSRDVKLSEVETEPAKVGG